MPQTTQLSLTEIDPDASHGADGVVPTVTGYRGRCLCGWLSDERPTKNHARGAVRSHLLRTLPGRQLIATLHHAR